MTAVIVYVTPNGAHLLTDGGYFGPDGKSVAQGQKVGIAAHQSAAYAARGPAMFSGLLNIVVGQQQGGFDDLAAAFPGLCRTAHAQMVQAVEAGTPVVGDPNEVDAVLIGWSQAHGYQALCVSSYPDGSSPAWEAEDLRRDVPLGMLSPADDGMLQRLRDQGIDVWAAQADPSRHGLAIMREQRRSTGIVDGFCQLTSVMTGGVFTTILERWPEVRIGTHVGGDD